MPKGKIEGQLRTLVNGEPRWYNDILIEQLGAPYREALIELIQRDLAKCKKLWSKLRAELENFPDIEISPPEIATRIVALAKEAPHVTGKDVFPFQETLDDLRFEICEAFIQSLGDRRPAHDPQASPARRAPVTAEESAGKKLRLPRSSVQTIGSYRSSRRRR